MRHVSSTVAVADSAEWPHLARTEGDLRDESLRDSSGATDANRGSSEGRDRLLHEPAPSRARRVVEQSPVEQVPDSAARRCVESVEFDPIRAESESPDKDREECRERR